MTSLPLIDFSPFLSPSSPGAQRQQVAAELDQACRTSGFFYLKGHGVPHHLLDGVRQHAIDFFQTASDADKHSLAIKSDDKARGYSKNADPEKGSHEALDFYRPVTSDGEAGEHCTTGQGINQWPSHPASFRSTAEAYIASMEGLGKSVIQALALALGIDPSLIVSRIDKAFWQLRMICYPGLKEGAVARAGIGEHTDFGILTFLLTDATTRSLQVRSKTGEWIFADPIEGAFLVNIGDMLSEWTRGAYVSTAHRVVHTSSKPRVSIPFFFDPNWDAFIEPVLPAAEGQGVYNKHVGVRYRDAYVRAIEEPLGQRVEALPA